MGNTQKLGNYVNAIFQDTSNNIGIGAAPSGTYKFEVTGTAKVSSTLLVSGAATFSSSVTINSSSVLKLGNSDNASTMQIWNSQSGAANNLLVYDNAASAYRFVINSSGNVGIGTSSPDNLLVVSGGTGSMKLEATTTNRSAIQIFNTANSLYIGVDNASASYFGYAANSANIQTLNYPIIFSNGSGAPLERMRITSAGKIEMGTTSVSGEVVKVTGTSGSDNYISVYSGTIQMFLDADATNSSGIVGTQSNHNMKLRSNGTNRMNIDTSGNIGAPNSGSNIYSASDVRLKQNIETIENGLDKIIALNPVKFNWIDGFVESEDGKDMLGFIAQEVQNAIPEAVEDFSSNSIIIGETTIENPLRVNEKFIIPVLVKAIQEQQATITSLQDRLDKLDL